MPKAAIHPTYYQKAVVTCACGASYEMGSTKESLKLDICSACHPFYTGNQKLIDTAGRVDRFREKMAKATKPAAKAEKVSEEVVPEAEAAEPMTEETVTEPQDEEATTENTEVEADASTDEEETTGDTK